MTPHRITDSADGPAILALLHRAFANMEGRINPPSSLNSLTVQGLFAAGEVWAIGTPPVACVIVTPRAGVLYLGKLAVDPAAQRQGHCRTLITLATQRAQHLNLPLLELQTRVELTENHRVFSALGFAEVARTAHPGFTHHTSITFRKKVPVHV